MNAYASRKRWTIDETDIRLTIRGRNQNRWTKNRLRQPPYILSNSIRMLIEIGNILHLVISCFKLFVEWFSGMNHYVNVHFGLFVQLALDLLILYIIFMVIYQLIKLSFRILFRIVIPSVILAGVVVFFTPYSFLNILPIFVCLLVVINLIRT